MSLTHHEDRPSQQSWQPYAHDEPRGSPPRRNRGRPRRRSPRSAWLTRRDGQEGFAQAGVEAERFRLEPVRPLPPPCLWQPRGRGRPPAAGRGSGSGPAACSRRRPAPSGQHGGVEAARRPLVGPGGIEEAVADHGLAPRQRRADQRLQWSRRAALNRSASAKGRRAWRRRRARGADLLGPGRAAGSRVHDHRAAGAGPQRLREAGRLGRLAGPLPAFEGDETPWVGIAECGSVTRGHDGLAARASGLPSPLPALSPLAPEARSNALRIRPVPNSRAASIAFWLRVPSATGAPA